MLPLLRSIELTGLEEIDEVALIATVSCLSFSNVWMTALTSFGALESRQPCCSCLTLPLAWHLHSPKPPRFVSSSLAATLACSWGLLEEMVPRERRADWRHRWSTFFSVLVRSSSVTLNWVFLAWLMGWYCHPYLYITRAVSCDHSRRLSLSKHEKQVDIWSLGTYQSFQTAR